MKSITIIAAILLGSIPAFAQEAPKPTIDKPHYAVTVTPPKGAVGEVVAKIHLVPKAGFKMNKAYPTKVRLAAPAGVKLKKALLKKADATSFTESEASFAVAYTCESAGDVKADVSFSVCNAQTCELHKETVTWTAATP